MAFVDLAHARYSVRKFKDKPIEREKLERILTAGQAAPTACNNQPQRILVVENAEAHEKIKKCTPFHFGAPIVLVICYDKSESWKRLKFDGKEFGEQDASIVASHLMLEAADLGMGTTWVGYFDPDAVRKEFALPENIVPAVLLPLGYPADDAVPNERHAQRKPLAETVFYNHFA